MREDLRRIAVLGSGVAELTKNRAEQMVKELMDRSKENRKEIVRLVRQEIENQIGALGLATKRDLERLERRITRLEAAAKEGRAGAKESRATGTKTKAPAKRTSGKKTTARPSSAT